MDVHTGAILALASYPSFDGNAYPTTDPALFSSPAVSREYEPGSVMKAMTVAAALDAGAITPADLFMDDNDLHIYDVVIHNADRGVVPERARPHHRRPRSWPSRTTSARPRSA